MVKTHILLLEGVIMSTVIIDGNDLTLEDFYNVVYKNDKIDFPDTEEFKKKINESRDFLENYINKGYPTYGVTTGFGDSCHNQINTKKSADLQRSLINFHGIGLGELFSEIEGRAVTLCRLNSNIKGFSAIRMELAERMKEYLNIGISPVIPQIGSVGASGDLTPLSYLGASLSGDRRVYYKGEIRDTKDVLKELSIEPLVLQAKEGLAIMNGTSVMTAIAAMTWLRIKKLSDISDFLTGLTAEVMQGKDVPFRARVSEMKNHPGQIESALKIHKTIEDSKRIHKYEELIGKIGSINDSGFKKHDIKIQDRYSIRCAPHINGVLRDTLNFTRNWIENEINSANDNPLIDVQEQALYNTGNFYGGHISCASDYLRIALANVSDLSEKQSEIIIDGKFNNITENLIPHIEDDAYEKGLRHGFKAAQISISAISAEIQFLAGPMSIHSRPTESLNQDKVSMGTISARKMKEMTDLMFLQVSIHLMALCQAMDLTGVDEYSSKSREVYKAVRKISPFLENDRPLDNEAAKVAEFLETSDLF